MGQPGGDEHHRTEPGRKKKLLAGVRFSLLISGDKGNNYECRTCNEKQRVARNCHNRQGLQHTILQGVDEWRLVSAKRRPVLKVGDIKFMACPRSTITPRTWQILRLVNETCGAEHCEILHLPFDGTILDQPAWYREAVEIVRTARAEHRRKQMEEMRRQHG